MKLLFCHKNLLRNLSLMLLINSGSNMYSQCANNNVLYTSLNPPSVGSTVSDGCVFGGEYVTVSVVSGNTYTFSTCGSYWDTSITLYNNTGGAAIAFNDDSAVCGFQSSITWTATFTGTLRVLVDTWDCYSYFDCAVVSVTWVSGPAAASNDACVNATPIGCGQTLSENTSTATAETVPLCDPFMTSGTRSRWYSFVGTGQTVTASLCGAAYDTEISVYSGSCGALTCAAYNDDFCGAASQTSWFATAGVTYYIRVAGYSSTDYGAFTLAMTCSTSAVTASDCVTAVDVCTNLNFQIDPNGVGNVSEIPPIGSYGNPWYFLGDGAYSPWGSDNEGCLQNNELNSTWMRVNIIGSGSLTFTFGGLGTQVGFYDWIMYPYNSSTCSNIFNDMIPPVRCNWNWVNYGGTGLASTIPAGGNPGNFEPPLNVLAGQQYIICFSNWSSATTTVPLQFGGTAVVGCQNIALPVELSEFTATANSGIVDLEWTTLSEINNDYFVVQRSIDQENWMDIGTVDGNGTTSDKSYYSFPDRNAMNGTNYYRLLQVDFNGETTSSKVTAASLRMEGQSVFPNPNSGEFLIRIPDVHGELKILNAQGRSMDYTKTIVNESAGLCKLTLTFPISGFYLLHDMTSGTVIRFVIN